MNRTSIRQSDVNDYIKSTKLIPSSNPLKLPSPDHLTGNEQISLTENPILVISQSKAPKNNNLDDLERLLLEKEDLIARLKNELSKRTTRSDDPNEKTQALQRQNEEMRKDIQFLRELLDANAKIAPSNNALLKELEVYKSRCEELTEVFKELKEENEKMKKNSMNQDFSLRFQAENERLNGNLRQLETRNQGLLEEKERLANRLRELEEKTLRSQFDVENQRKFEVILSENQGKMAHLSQELEVYKEKLALLATENERLNALLQSKEENMRNLAIELKKTHDLLQKERENVENHRQEKEKKAGVHQENSKILGENQNLKESIRSMALEIEQLNGSLKRNEDKNRNILQENEKNRELIKRMAPEIESLTQEMERMKVKGLDFNRDFEAAKGENIALKESLKKLVREIEDLQTALKLKEGEAEKNAQREIIKLKVVISEYEEKMKHISEESKDFGRLKGVISEFEEKNEGLKRKTRDLAEELVQATNKLHDVENKLRILSEENIRLKDNVSLADSSLQRDVTRLKGLVNDYEEKIVMLSQELERGRVKSLEMNRRIEEFESSERLNKSKITGDLRILEEANEFFKRESIELKERVKRLSQDNDELRENIRSHHQEKDHQEKEKRSHFTGMEQENADLKRKCKELAEELIHNMTRIAECEGKIRVLTEENIKTRENMNVTAELTRLRGIISEFEDKFAMVSQENERLRIRIREGDAQKNSLQEEIESLQRLRLQTSQISELSTENGNLREKIKKLVIEIEELTQVLRSKDAKVQELEIRMMGSPEKNELSRIKGLLNDYEEKIVLLTHEVERWRVKSVELESSERLKKSRVSGELQILEEANEFMKRETLGLKEEINRLSQENDRLKEDIRGHHQEKDHQEREKRSHFTGLEKENADLKQKCKELAEELMHNMNQGGKMSEIFNENAAIKEKIKRLAIEIEELTQVIRGKDSKIRELELNLQGNLEETSKNAQREVLRLKGQINEYEEKVVLLSQEIERWRTKTVELNNELEMTRVRLVDFERNESMGKSRVSSEIQNMEIVNERLKDENNNMKEKLKKLLIEIEELAQAIRIKDSKIHELEFKFQGTSEEIQRSMQIETMKLKGILNEYEEKIALLSSENERLRVQSAEMSKDLESFRIKFQEVEHTERLKKSRVSSDLQTLEQTNEFLKNENLDLKEKLKKLLNEIDELAQAIRIKDSKIHEIEFKFQGTSEEIQRSMQAETIRLKGTISEYEEKFVLLSQEIERWKVKSLEMSKDLENSRIRMEELQHSEHLKKSKITSDLHNFEQEAEFLRNENNDLKDKLRKVLSEIEELAQVIRSKDIKIREFEFKLQTASDDSNFRSELLHLKATISEYEDKLALLTPELERVRGKNAELLREIENYRESDFIKKENLDLKEKLKKLLNEIEELAQAIRIKDSKIHELEFKFQGTSEEIQRSMQMETMKLKGILSEYEEKIALLSSENERLRVQSAEMSKDLKNSRIKMEELQHSEHLKKSKITSDLHNFEQEAEFLRNENNDLKDKLRKVLSEIEDLAQVIRSKDIKIREIEFKLQTASDDSNFRSELLRLKATISEYEDKLALLTPELERVRGKNTELLREIENYRESDFIKKENLDLKEKLKKLLNEIEELAQAIRIKDSKIHELEFKFQGTSEEIQRSMQIETMKLKGILNEYEEKIALLSSENERLRVQSAEMSKDLKNSRIKMQEDEHNERLKKSRVSSDLQTLEQTNEFLKNENLDLKEKLKKLLNEIDELAQAIRIKDSKIHEIEFKFQGTSEEIQRSMQAETIRLKGIISEYEEKFVLLSQEIERWKVKSLEMSKDLENSRIRMEELQHSEHVKKSKISSDLHNFEQEAEFLRSENNDLKDKLRKVLSEIEELAQVIRSKDIKIREFEFKLQTASDDSNNRNELLRLKATISEYEDKLALLTPELERLHGKNDDLLREIQQLQSNQNLQTVTESLRRENISLKENLKRLISEIEELNSVIRNKEARIRDFEANLHGETLKIQTLNAETLEKSKLLQQEVDLWRNKFIELTKEYQLSKQKIEDFERDERLKRSKAGSELQILEQDVASLKRENLGYKENLKRLVSEIEELTRALQAKERLIAEMEAKFKESTLRINNIEHEERVKQSRISVESQEMTTLRQRIQEYEEKVVMLSSELERLRVKESSTHRLITEIQELNATLRDKENRIRELESQISLKTSSNFELESVQSKLRQLEGMQRLMEGNLQEKDSIIQSLNVKLIEAKANENNANVIKELMTELSESQKLLRSLEGVKSENQTLRFELENLKSERNSIHERLKKSSNSSTDFESRLAMLSAEKEALHQEISALKASQTRSLELKEQEIQHYRQIVEEYSFKITSSTSKTEVIELQNQKQELMIALDSANAKNRSLTSQLEMLHQQINDLNRQLSQVQSKPVLVEDSSKIRELLGELELTRRRTLDLEEKMLSKDAKMAELGLLAMEIERLMAVIRQKDQNLARVVTELQETNTTLANYQAKSSIKQAKTEDVLLLEQEIMRLKGLLAAREQEISRVQGILQEEITRKRQDFSGKEGEINILSERNQELTVLKEKLGFEKEELRSRVTKYEEKLSILAGEVERLKGLNREQETLFEEKRMRQAQELAVLSGKLREFELKSQFSQVSDTRSTAVLQENESLRLEVSENQRTISNLKRFVSELEAALNSGSNRLEISELRAKIEGLEATIQKNQQVYQANLGKLIEEITALNMDLKKKVSSTEIEHEFDTKMTLLAAEIDRLNGELQTKNLQLMDVSAKEDPNLTNLRLEISEKNREIESLAMKNLELAGQVKGFLNKGEMDERAVMLACEIERLNEVLHVKIEENSLWKQKFEDLLVKLNQKERENEEKMALLAQEILRLTNVNQGSPRPEREEHLKQAKVVERVEDNAVSSEKMWVLIKELERFQSLIAEKAEEVEDSRSEKEKTKAIAEGLKRENVELLEKMAVLAKEIERLGQILARKEEEIGSYKGLEGKVNMSAESAQVYMLQERLGFMENRLKASNTEIERLNNMIQEKVRLYEDEENLLMKMKSLEKEQNFSKDEVDRLRSMLKSKTSEIEHQKSRIVDLETEILTRRGELGEVEETNGLSIDKIGLMAAENLLITGNLDLTNKENTRIRSILEAKNGEIESLRTELEKNRMETLKLADYQGKIRVLLTEMDKLNSILTEKMQDNLALNEQLAHMRFSQSMPVERVTEEYENQIRYLKEQLETVESTKRSHAKGGVDNYVEEDREKEQNYEELVGILKVQLAKKDSEYQATTETHKFTILQLTERIEELNKYIQEKTGLLEPLTMQLELTNSELERLKTWQEQALSEIEGLKVELSQKTLGFTLADEKNRDLEAKTSLILKELETVTGLTKEYQRHLEQAHRDIIQRDSALKANEKEVARFKEVIAGLRSDCENMNDKLLEFELARAGNLALEEKIKLNHDNIGAILKENSDLILMNKRIHETLDIKDSEIQALRRESDKYKESLQRLLSENEKLAIGLDLSTTELKRKSINPLGVSRNALNVSSASMENEGNNQNARMELKQALEDMRSLRDVVKDLASQNEQFKQDNQTLKLQITLIEDEKEQLRLGYENIRNEFLQQSPSKRDSLSMAVPPETEKVEALIHNLERVTSENVVLKQKIEAYSIELLTKDVSNITSAGGNMDKMQLLEKSLLVKVQELEEYQERVRMLEAKNAEIDSIVQRMRVYEEKTLIFSREVDRLSSKQRESNEEIMRISEALVEKEAELAGKKHLEFEIQALKEEKEKLLSENEGFIQVLRESKRDIDDLSSDRKALMLKVNLLLEQNQKLQDRLGDEKEVLVIQQDHNRLLAEISLLKQEKANFQRIEQNIREKIEVSIELEIRDLKERHGQERILWEQEMNRLRGSLEAQTSKSEELERGLMETMRVNESIKDLYEKEKGEKLDMNEFYMSEMQNLKGRFEASIVQRVETGLKDIMVKMQAEKSAYERIIVEKDRQLEILKEIIKKLEDSSSKDLDFLKEESFKVKEAQIELLESEKTAEKLSFLGLVEQLKAQITNFEALLENKSAENKRLAQWNLEKSKDLEQLKESHRELKALVEDWKGKGDQELSEAVIRASKEKTLMETQIRTLRKTIENQKEQIEMLFSKMQEKEKGELID